MLLNVPDVDPSTDATWFGTAGVLLQIPLDPQLWLQRACEVAGRELTAEEWYRFVPGDTPKEPACTNPSDGS